MRRSNNMFSVALKIMVNLFINVWMIILYPYESVKTAFLSGDSFQFILAGFISYWMSIFPCQLNFKNPFLKVKWLIILTLSNNYPCQPIQESLNLILTSLFIYHKCYWSCKIQGGPLSNYPYTSWYGLLLHRIWKEQ